VHRRLLLILVVAFIGAVLCASAAHGDHIDATTGTGPEAGGSSHIMRVLRMEDFNTRIVVLATSLLGLAAGVVGCYMLLRKRALMGDALSHATLPGIVCAFAVMAMVGGDGRWLPGLLLGATISGVLAIGIVNLLASHRRLGQDTALGVVLSVFFGLGITLIRVVQSRPRGVQAGLESFILGKTASIITSDAILIAVVASVVVVVCTLLYKEFLLLSFDRPFGSSQGMGMRRLDGLMMMMVIAVTVVGLQAVGLILVIALLITPAAAARFWTDHLRTMLITAACIGAASGFLGAMASAMFSRLPAGAIIVLVAAGLFVISLLIGAKRGVLVQMVRHRRLRRTMALQHVLRAMYECTEHLEPDAPATIAFDTLRGARSWNAATLQHSLARAARMDFVRQNAAQWMLTDEGRAEATRLVRNHRLWEMYLIRHADIAPSHVDRDADMIEHVLDAPLIRELERMLADRGLLPPMPASPHTLPVVHGRNGGRRRC
jgi:manganese/zinc/iron transport system permease protein